MSSRRSYDLQRDPETGGRHLVTDLRGRALLGVPMLNKGTAFTTEERRTLGLEGLLPSRVTTIDEQADVAWQRYRTIADDLDRHVHLRGLQDENEVLFHALVARHLADLLPRLYTPTVGDAVRAFSRIHRRPRGLVVTADDVIGGRLPTLFDNLDQREVRLAVVTDAAAILGIGDQGVGGLSICIGKLTLYTAGGGLAPDATLPVVLDVGTDRAELLDDPHYLGVRSPRLVGDAYDTVVDRFVEEFHRRFPEAVLQWEDLSKDTAFAVLERHRDRAPSFNDDIQGTGAVALAGVLSACRLKGEKLADQRVVVHGAGAGGVGVAAALVDALRREGLSEEEARSLVLVLDSRGLLVEGRAMEAYKQPFAQRVERVAGWGGDEGVDLYETVVRSRATVVIGLSGQAGVFDERLVRAMTEHTERPVVFPLSNPTSSSEAVPADVLRWSGGRALVATGSPFADVVHDGERHVVGQGNNAFVFPGLGLGTVLVRASTVSDEMVAEAARALVDYTTAHHPGLLYPPVGELRAVSQLVATRVAAQAIREGRCRDAHVAGLLPEELAAYVADHAWHPAYLPIRPDGPAHH